MNALPIGWARLSIEQVAADEAGALTDGPFGSNLKTSHYTPTGPRVIRLQNIGDGVFHDEKSHISAEHFRRLRKHEVLPGDVVIAMLGETLPRACPVPPHVGPAIVKADCVRLRVHPALASAPFVAHALNSHQVRTQAAALVHGVGRPRLGLKWFRKLEMPLPPSAEQTRILEAIDSYFTRLDEAVVTLERVQRNLKRYRASVLKAAVEGRLVPTEAELARAEGRDYEPASVLLDRILAERRRRWEEAELAKMKINGKLPKDDRWKAKYTAPVALEATDLPTLPDGWCWASVDQITSRITSGSRDWTQYYDQGDSVFLMAQNVRPGQLDLSHRQTVGPPTGDASCERSQVRVHDLLVTIVGANTGNACRVPTELPRHYVCQSVALMRPVDSTVSPYLDAYLNSPLGQKVYKGFMYGQGRPHLSFDNLRETPVPLPPAREQARIVESVERRETVAATVAVEFRASTDRFRSLRQSILKWAFEGRLVDQDPTDEPASQLLERIQAERSGTRPAPGRRRAKRPT